MFQPLEKFSIVRLVVSEVLCNPAHEFTLSAYGKVIGDEDIPLAQLGLVSRLCTALIMDKGSYMCVKRECVQMGYNIILLSPKGQQLLSIARTVCETRLGSVLLSLPITQCEALSIVNVCFKSLSLLFSSPYCLLLRWLVVVHCSDEA